MSSLPPAADARQETPEPTRWVRWKHEHLNVTGADVEQFSALCAVHNAAIDEIERLQAIIESAGGLCECGHLEHSHILDEDCINFEDCRVSQCACKRFTPLQTPAEGEQ